MFHLYLRRMTYCKIIVKKTLHGDRPSRGIVQIRIRTHISFDLNFLSCICDWSCCSWHVHWDYIENMLILEIKATYDFK